MIRTGLLACLVLAVVVGFVYSAAHREALLRQMEQGDQKTLRQQVLERECKLKWPTLGKYYDECLKKVRS